MGRRGAVWKAALVIGSGPARGAFPLHLVGLPEDREFGLALAWRQSREVAHVGLGQGWVSPATLSAGIEAPERNEHILH